MGEISSPGESSRVKVPGGRREASNKGESITGKVEESQSKVIGGSGEKGKSFNSAALGKNGVCAAIKEYKLLTTRKGSMVAFERGAGSRNESGEEGQTSVTKWQFSGRRKRSGAWDSGKKEKRSPGRNLPPLCKKSNLHGGEREFRS